MIRKAGGEYRHHGARFVAWRLDTRMIIGFIEAPVEECLPQLKAALESHHKFVEPRPTKGKVVLVCGRFKPLFLGRSFFSPCIHIEIKRNAVRGTIVGVKSVASHLCLIALLTGLAGVGWSAYRIFDLFLAGSSQLLFAFQESGVWIGPLALAIFGLYEHSRTEVAQGWAWTALRTQIAPLVLERWDRDAWAVGDPWSRVSSVAGSTLVLGVGWGLFVFFEFPILLTSLLFIPWGLRLVVANLLPADAHETAKKRLVEVSTEWVHHFTYSPILLYCGIVWLSHSFVRLCEAISPALSAGEKVLAPPVHTLVGSPWFPLEVPNCPITLTDAAAIVTNGRLLESGSLHTIPPWLAPVAGLLMVFFSASVLLIRFRAFFNEYPPPDRYSLRHSSAGTSRSFRLLLVLVFVCYTLVITASVLIVFAFMASLFFPELARASIVASPILIHFEFTSATLGVGAFPWNVLLTLVVIVSLCMAVFPSILFTILDEFRTRRLQRLHLCQEPALKLWLGLTSRALRIRGEIDLAIVPATPGRPLVYTKMHGIVKRKRLIVVAEDLLDTLLLPREELHAALTHEIVHARLDSGLVSFLAKLSVFGGLGRGFLSLVVDYHEMEFRADDEVAAHFGETQSLAQALRRIEMLQAVLRLSTSEQNRTGVFQMFANILNCAFNPEVLASAYLSTSSRIRRLESVKPQERSVPVSSQGSFWNSRISQWTIAIAVLLVPPTIGILVPPKNSFPIEFYPLSDLFGAGVQALAVLEGNLLLGTANGLLLLDTDTLVFSRPDWLAEVPVAGISRIVVRKDEIWVASYIDGVARFRNGVWDTFRAPVDLPSNAVLDMAAASDKAVWVGTTRGLAILNSTSSSANKQQEIFRNRTVISLAPDEGQMAVATIDEIVHFGNVARLQFEGHKKASVNAEYISGVGLIDGNLWALTQDNIYTYQGGAWLARKNEQPRLANVSRGRIIGTNDHVVILGTKSRDNLGTVGFFQDGKWDIRVGFLHFHGTKVRDVINFSGRLWIATDKGLSYISRTKEGWDRTSRTVPVIRDRARTVKNGTQ